jgi:rubrerythrin
VPGEEFEYHHLYQMLATYAQNHFHPLAKQAYTGAAEAEKEHAHLLKEAKDMEHFEKNTFYICPICGYLMSDQTHKDRCPVCGGPKNQYKVFSALSDEN